MKRNAIAMIAVVALVAALAVPALAGGAKDVKLVGWVSDSCCPAKNANAEGKSCIMECHKNGSALVFFSEGKTYKLADEKPAMANIGYEVVVTGTVSEDGTLKIASIEPSKKKA